MYVNELECLDWTRLIIKFTAVVILYYINGSVSAIPSSNIPVLVYCFPFLHTLALNGKVLTYIAAIHPIFMTTTTSQFIQNNAALPTLMNPISTTNNHHHEPSRGLLTTNSTGTSSPTDSSILEPSNGSSAFNSRLTSPLIRSNELNANYSNVPSRLPSTSYFAQHPQQQTPPLLNPGSTRDIPLRTNSIPNIITTTQNNGGGGGGSIILPPISSFDSLILAAQSTSVTNTKRSNSLQAGFTIPVPEGSNLKEPIPIHKPKSRRTLIPRSSSVSHTSSNSNSIPSFNTLLASSIQNSPVTTPSISADSILNNIKRDGASEGSQSDVSIDGDSIHTNATDKTGSGNNKGSVTKTRRKKQCPTCLNYYANLSTHKSTHLTPEDRPHKCPICERGFARNNDLIRHKKRHWKDEFKKDKMKLLLSETGSTDLSTKEQKEILKKNQLKALHQIRGAFKCPYNKALIDLDMETYPYKSKNLNFTPLNCHQTGVFSRCDTYKNHLKALHFEYPPKTKKEDRAVMPGNCKHCGMKFENVDVWLNKHVGKDCGYYYH